MKKILLISCMFSTLLFMGCSSNQTKLVDSNNKQTNVAMNKSHKTKHTSNIQNTTKSHNASVVYPEEVKVNAQGQPEPVFIN